MNTKPEFNRAGSQASPSSTEPEHDATILVVDDEPELSRALSKLLSRNGYHVLTDGNGEEGLAILRRQEIHLVLSDLQMPKMGGLDLLKAAQVIAPNTEFVIITGHGTIETAVDAMRTGAYDFIEKPSPLPPPSRWSARPWKSSTSSPRTGICGNAWQKSRA